MELRLDLPVGHGSIPFEELQGFVRLAELGGAGPSDPVIGVAPEGDKEPEALRIMVNRPAEWNPHVTLDKELVMSTLILLAEIRDAHGNARGLLPDLVSITGEFLRALTE